MMTTMDYPMMELAAGTDPLNRDSDGDGKPRL